MGPDQEPVSAASRAALGKAVDELVEHASRLPETPGTNLRVANAARLVAYLTGRSQWPDGTEVPDGYVAPKLTDLGSEPGPFADDDMRSPFHRDLEEALAHVPTDPLELNSIAPQYRASLVSALLDGHRAAFLRNKFTRRDRDPVLEVRHLREVIAGEVIRLLGEVYHPEGVQLWLSSSQGCFGGRSANELLKTGDVERVLEFAHQIADGNFA